jgi:CRISPR system Cascade subunit CasA
MRIAILLPCLFLCACATYAPRPMDVASLNQPALTALPDGDLLPVALAHSPAVAAARAAYEAARHDRDAQKRLPPMTLTLVQEYSKQADAQKPWLYTEQLDVPLDVGGRRAGRITTADIAVDKARYALGDALWTVRSSLRQAESDLLFARQTIALDEQLVEARGAYRDVVERQVKAGEEIRATADQARLDLSAAQITLRQAEAARDQAEIALAKALDATPAAAHGWQGLNPTLSAIDDAQIDNLAAKAPYARSDIHTAVIDYATSENDLRLAVAGQYPDIHLAPGYTWERGVVKLPLNWTLTLPPTDLNRANIAAATARRTAAGKTLEEAVKSAQAEIAQAASTWRADTAAAVRATDDDAPLAETMAMRTEHGATAGENNKGDALLARITALDARNTALTAQQTAANDRFKLEDALRQPFTAGDAAALSAAAASEPKK